MNKIFLAFALIATPFASTLAQIVTDGDPTGTRPSDITVPEKVTPRQPVTSDIPGDTGRTVVPGTHSTVNGDKGITEKERTAPITK